jgi:hypothetical protein
MPLPEFKYGLICEDIRFERRNLTSFMGVYGSTPHVGIKISDFKLPVNFCVVFYGDPAQGKFTIDAQLHNLDATRIEADVLPKKFEFTFATEMGGAVIAFRFKAVFPGPGTYAAVLLTDDKLFHRELFNLLPSKPTDFL